jgi:ATP-binding cassette, subfamily B, heavy metal transporter
MYCLSFLLIVLCPCRSVRNYQLHSTSTQASLSLLNVLQQLIMHLTLLAGLVLAAKSVISGRYTVGDFVSVNTYMVNLFTPLNFLGTVYNVSARWVLDGSGSMCT